MILKALKYGSNWFGKNSSIVSGDLNDDLVRFENINLIVGRNASGKTRLIEAIRWISDLFEDKAIGGGLEGVFFEVIFENTNNTIKYDVRFDKDKYVLAENLYVNGESKLDRNKGLMYYEKLGRFLDFQIDNLDLAISRKDNLQQPFFDILHNWGKNVSHYSFGDNMGKLKFDKQDDFKKLKDIHFKNFNSVRAIYHKANKDLGELFEARILDDMAKIDYKILSISSDKVYDYPILKVKEIDLPFETDFEDMSQGMARAFSLIVQLNYSLMAKIPSCILIDDIGEGLDYDRSKKLIELIIEKAKNTNIQLFMTTNDRFVMNNVPLKYWSVIHREGNKSVFYNYQNSKQTFDDFALTGFNNFDFFTTEFYRLGFEEFLQTAQ